MAHSATITVEVDAPLLERLRARYPGKSDREIIESIARIDLGFQALSQSQARNALSEEDSMEHGVDAVHEERGA